MLSMLTDGLTRLLLNVSSDMIMLQIYKSLAYKVMDNFSYSQKEYFCALRLLRLK